jgi:hypothetical protein
VQICTVSRRGPRATLVGVHESRWRAQWPIVVFALVALLAVVALLALPWALLHTGR